MFTPNDKETIRQIIADQASYVSAYRKRKYKQGRLKIREIIVPNEVYKNLQQKILFWFQRYNVFKISKSSFAWIPGKSREMCADRHVGYKYLLETDISDYFGSIKNSHLDGLFVYNERIAYLLNLLEIEMQELIEFLTLSKNNGRQRYLPQGFPTSPIIANAIRYNIDLQIENIAADNSWVYSAYGDNLYLSGASVPKDTIDKIDDILKLYGFAISRHKCKVMPYYRRQSVLGIVVNQKASISKDYLHSVMGQIIGADTVDSKLLGRINQFRISDNPRNFKYLNKLMEKVHAKPGL